MSRKIDFEVIADAIKAVCTTYLNTKLLAIATEIGDGIVLTPINANAYAFHSMNEAVMNHDPFILYGVESAETISEMGNSAKNALFSVALLMSDNGTNEVTRRMFRYGRALEEIFQTNFKIVGTGSSIKINNVLPIDLQGLNSALNYKAVGITLEVSFA